MCSIGETLLEKASLLKAGTNRSKEDWSILLPRRDTASICVKWLPSGNLYAEPSHFSAGSMSVEKDGLARSNEVRHGLEAGGSTLPA
jgi:hypothetical protein